MSPPLTLSKNSASPPQLTMEPIDPARISQMSRRKLRFGSCDERRDTYNLRRLVLIQNSLVSANSCVSSPSTSRTPPQQCAKGLRPPHNARPLEGDTDDDDDDEYGFGFVFPDISSWDERTAEAEVDEADWLDAVLSDLDDDSTTTTDDCEQTSPPPPAHVHIQKPFFPHNTTLLLTSIFPPHVPLSQSNANDATPSCYSSVCDGLPYFDVDDTSDSEDSSEPSTPLSASILGSRDDIQIATTHEDNVRPGPSDIPMEDEKTVPFFPSYNKPAPPSYGSF
ncbi:hypothetical protein BS47DRAFT_1357017 [Hydnum rufescens UP504]|uniref:Uncharacterized protein n=1 Tax=Hydnum rufescens UP504 TaxID=1448309 RepID=A0A9P6BC93_9AGAM|nr:hypothetical protein BS47DRAFT_1357017 [Hydnum rufescens UP504]